MTDPPESSFSESTLLRAFLLYGDVRPRSDGAKLFSCVYALGGIGIIGIALGYIGQNIVHARMMAMHGVEKK
eukprot:CAMPEP_0116070948 /NCGR_PEP_ID=MMETSP0322-20121206/13413_1 /TAXON_ID=163516 /ORGANISM="Leptocylindrus danicus var. apora, Strain B651" /LENGTH=71 /DNA_ID=CAMNT_0003559053 /DNA_START=264 /DNA_END=476 /DNA_ORIENTATION=+